MNVKSDIQSILEKPYSSAENCQEMREICRKFLTRYNLSSFEFQRVYDDGTCFTLHTDHFILEKVMKERVPVTVHVPMEALRDEFWYLLPNSNPYSQLIREIKTATSSNTFADYIKRYPGYFDMFCFWSPFDHDRAANKFINLRGDFERFTSYFQDKASSMIRDADTNRFEVPNDMLPNFKGLEKQSQMSNDEFSSRVIQIIERDLFKPIQIRDLAKLTGASSSSLAKKFRESTQYSPFAYIRSRRLEEAMKLIKTRNHSIGEVALKVGFENFGAFSEAFKAKFGQSPSFYKKF